MKKCRSCHKRKKQNAFYKDSSRASGYSYICKSCKNTMAKKWKLKNKEKMKKYFREYRKKNPEKNRETRKKYYQKYKNSKILSYDLNKKYGITLLEYQILLKKQGKVCAICLKKCEHKERLSVDHDHKTGIVRGLLCDSCNNGISRFQDNINLLKNAIKYLK